MSRIRINIISDNKDIAILSSTLQDKEFSVFYISDKSTQEQEFKKDSVLILYLTNNDTSKWSWLFKQSKTLPSTVLIVLDGCNASIVSSVARMGFNNIYVFPFDIYKFDNHFHEILNNLIVAGDNPLNKGPEIELNNNQMHFAESESSRKLKEVVMKIATSTDSNLLLLGETGTGKSNLAKFIHNNSERNGAPFVDIVCNSIPPNLLESELFGYEKGSFTDAKSSKIGLFEVAEDGTIFLDEIGDLSIDIQAKLLRVIEKKYFRRIGGTREIPVNARIISSTNKNLSELIVHNLFRRDLYYRLNTFSIEIPPLRERPEEIPYFADLFLKEFSERFDKYVPEFNDEVLSYIISYDWPGNLRELKHTIERAVLLGDERDIDLDLIKRSLGNKLDKGNLRRHVSATNNRIDLTLDYKKEDLESLEKIYARMVLEKEKGNKSKTARALNISRPKLDKLLKD